MEIGIAEKSSEITDDVAPSASMLIPPSRVVRRAPAAPGPAQRARDEALRPGLDDRLARPIHPATGRGPTRRSAHRDRTGTWAFLLVAMLVTWFGLARQGLLPTPSAWAETGLAPMRVLEVSLGALLAVAIGAAIGVLLAVSSGLSWWGRLLGDVSLRRLRWVPLLGPVGLAGLWLGPVRSSLVPILVLAAAVPAYTRADRAIRDVDGRFVDLAGTVGLGRGDLVRQVILPGALPGAVGGVRMSLAIGWLVLTVSELAAVGAHVGLPLTVSGVSPGEALLALVVSGVLWLVADVGLRAVTTRALVWAE